MRRVAVVGFASEVVPAPDGRNEAELAAPAVDRALAAAGVARSEVGVLCTAGSEFLNGVVGTVMGAFDALPGWPPRSHSHLEADGAFALYEAWVRLMAGEAELALVCSFSRPMATDAASVLQLQLDPYLTLPLGPGIRSIAAIQARALLEEGRYGEEDLARVVSERRGSVAPAELLRRPYVASPLRELDCPSICVGAAAVVLAVEGHAGAAASSPAWIRGIEHRAESSSLGQRDLVVTLDPGGSPQPGPPGDRSRPRRAARPVQPPGADPQGRHLRERLGSLNPSGGALVADPLMTTGLVRIGEAARAILEGRAGRAVGHASNGPCLQQNLLCLMEAD